MCEIITVFAAAFFIAWHFRLKARGAVNNAVFTTGMMFLGAALMWSVDCVAGALDGEPLFDISLADTVLGVIVLAAGLLVFAVLSLRQRRLARTA